MGSLDDFNPNAVSNGNWATYIPNRHPRFKVHVKRSHATSALGVKFPYCSGVLYERVDGEWIERDRMEAPKECAVCEKIVPSWGKRVVRLGLRPAYKNPVACDECYTAYGYGRDSELVNYLRGKYGI